MDQQFSIGPEILHCYWSAILMRMISWAWHISKNICQMAKAAGK